MRTAFSNNFMTDSPLQQVPVIHLPSLKQTVNHRKERPCRTYTHTENP